MSDSAAADSSQRLRDYQWCEVHFDPEPDYEFVFDGLRGHEELGRPFLYELDLTTGKIRPDIQKLVGSGATVWMLLSDTRAEGSGYYINGIVTRVLSAGVSGGSFRYRLELRPWIWLLSRKRDHRIFNKKSPFDIITTIFQEFGFSGNVEDKRQAGSGDMVLDYCVQYGETSLDFVTRLMETYGIYYYFKHEDHKHTLVLADDPNAHEPLKDPLPFRGEQNEVRTVTDRCWSWMSEQTLHSGNFQFQDYNFTTPSADLSTKASQPGDHNYKDYEMYEYPGYHEETGTGQKLSDIRMQAINADRAVYQSLSNCRKLRPGVKFTLSEHPDQALNREYLITYAEFEMKIGEGRSTYEEQGETYDTYRTSFRAIPGDTHFRLHRTTQRPRIRGPQTAKVVGPSGDEIYTDEYGRIKVKFHWDRSDTADDERTCWMRVAQSWAGSGWGSIFIPRVGQEVVVIFLEGDPDRPLVVGVVYNATQKVPYTLPANKTQSGIKTNSSTGGIGFNELRFEDKAGSEEVYFQAQKDYTKKVLNNETVNIKNDTTTTVESGNRSVTVSSGNDSTTVSSGNHSLSVSSGASTTEAAQSVTIKVGGNSIVIDTSSITITVGGTSIKLSPSGIESSAPQIQTSASASMTISGGGSLSMSAGMISIN